MTPTIPMFLPLTGLYEPSAIQQLADGRFLVVEDEKGRSFSLVTLSASGDVSSKSLGPGWFHGGDPIWKLDDLEKKIFSDPGTNDLEIVCKFKTLIIPFSTEI